jgi:hypothetical protein
MAPPKKTIVGAAGAGAKDIASRLSSIFNPPDESVLINPLERLSAQMKMFEEGRKSFIKTGYAKDIQNLGDAFGIAAGKSLELFGNINQGKASMDAFRTNTKAFVFMTTDFRKNMLTMTTAMQGLGFEAKTLAEIVDSGMYAFKNSSTELEGLMNDFVSMSRNLSIPGDELARNFRSAQQNFAYSADVFKKNFKDLQVMARDTGLSFDSLTGTFGSSFDSFEGAATKAGQLNQILGKSAFNSIELLNMTEAQRAKKIKEQFASRDPDKMGKFELLAIKDTLGLGSIEDTRKYLRKGGPGDESSLDSEKYGALEGRFGAPTKGAANALTDVGDDIRKARGPLQAALIGLGNTIGAKTKEINLGWIVVEKILRSQPRSERLTTSEFAKAKTEFAKLSAEQRTHVTKFMAINATNAKALKNIAKNIDTQFTEGFSRNQVGAATGLTSLRAAIKGIDADGPAAAAELAKVAAALVVVKKSAGVLSSLTGVDEGIIAIAALEVLAEKLKELEGTAPNLELITEAIGKFFTISNNTQEALLTAIETTTQKRARAEKAKAAAARIP